MPQTSPMNWIILSTSSILSILYIFMTLNEKASNNTTKMIKFNLTMKSWNW